MTRTAVLAAKGFFPESWLAGFGDGLSLLAAASSGSVVVVEPYLAGTSAFAVSAALASRPHRLLSLGVQDAELRRYGTPGDHARWQGLDAAGIRRSVTSFLAWLRL